MSTSDQKTPSDADEASLEATDRFSSLSTKSSSRSAILQASMNDDKARSIASSLPWAQNVDHTVSHIRRLSRREYPSDCPPMQPRWFHAVDVPKRKAFSSSARSEPLKPDTVAKKYIAFSASDSRAVETAFQRLANHNNDDARQNLHTEQTRNSRISCGLDGKDKAGKGTLVSVNEDYLFDVDVEKRELAPAYWLGPIYDVRRGTWFTSADGIPCDENLATQLEEGFLQVQPWKFVQGSKTTSQSQSLIRANSLQRPDQAVTASSFSRPSSPKKSFDAADPSQMVNEKKSKEERLPQTIPRTFRLFGRFMGSVVTYEDETIAYILKDDLYSRMSSTVYGSIAWGAHRAGIKVTRGYQEGKKIETAATDMSKASHSRVSSRARTEVESTESKPEDTEIMDEISKTIEDVKHETARQKLERHMSSIVSSLNSDQEEEARKQDEKAMREDYNEDSSDQQGREIEHLILVTHGIGQRLGLRLESIDFIHNVNTLRKKMKSVYADSPDLQALNSETDQKTKNCRIQVLPICWRHLLDFPQHSLKHNRKEHDLGDANKVQDEEYPSLEDITVQGVPAIRNLMTDLGLDILLYQSPIYKAHISKIVLEECNRIYKLWKERNPNFKGKVSLLGHSLGSAVMFDILCKQPFEDDPQVPSSKRPRHAKHEAKIQLNFDVEDFYAFGSPVGLFQMLKGRTIAARSSMASKSTNIPFAVSPSDAFAGQSEIAVSSPKCKQIFNIFHPSDPIAYRFEPLVSLAMASLQPQPLPYTKKGIFGAPAGQGLYGVGARVGQSMSGLWSSLSSGIANTLLNRSLGLSTEEANRLADPMPKMATMKDQTASQAALLSRSLHSLPLSVEDAKNMLADNYQALERGDEGTHPPTLLNAGLETLFSGFKKQQEIKPDIDGPKGRAEKQRQVQYEDGKLHSLNKNGRIDYAIQEGAFDISILASLASHLAYWADEDVSHFMISQLLSGNRVMKDSPTKY